MAKLGVGLLVLLSVATMTAETTAAPIDIPTKVFVALELPDVGKGIGRTGTKHVTWAHNPVDGRVYSMGGDFESSGAPASYHQDMFSFSIAERWASQADRNAGWRLEYPYCGPDGGVQPKSPDFVGWTWDPKRSVFWMVPGTMVQPVSAVCSDRTVSTSDDAKYKFKNIMYFDPSKSVLTDRWTDYDSNAGPFSSVEFWQSIYDPQTDSLIRPSYDGGSGDKVSHYNIITKTWVTYDVGSDSSGKDFSIHRGMIAANLAGRVFYAVGAGTGRLYRYNIDSHTMTDLSAVPGGPVSFGSDGSNNTYVAWDSVNRVLLFFRVDTRTIHIYHPDTTTWESPTVPCPSCATGVVPMVRHAMVFDPYQNVLMLIGNTDYDDGGPPDNPYMYLYRYANGSSSDLIAPAAPKGLKVN